MSGKPDLIDNLRGNDMATVLQKLISVYASSDGVDENKERQITEARIATAYFSPAGFSRVAQALREVSSIKLMLGSDPITDGERWQRQLHENESRFISRKLQENLKKQEELLRAERDHIPFSREASSSVKQLVNSLKAGNMQVRRYEKTFMHAKAYIFTGQGSDGQQDAFITGSSNLTDSGLTTNLELNASVYDQATTQEAVNWFEELWETATPFDLAAFFEEIFEARDPFDIFLRVLWELYGEEVDRDLDVDQGLPLTTFQKHGVARALRLIEETGGVIVADEVGLGKTFIAGEILNVYKERRQRALLICPAALRDSSWRQFKSDFEMHLETLSFEELAQDEQLWDESRRPNARSKNLDRNIEEYQLIIIDEAHNYRNPDSPTRADALRTLLYGRRKDVLMLTATPVNNSLWDLYHLTRFFLKQDSFLASRGILSIKERFDYAMRTNPNSLSPDVLYPIVDATTVKRTRHFIKKHYPNDEVKINGVMQTIVFPEPVAISVRYDLDSLVPGLFELIETYFDPTNTDCFKFARYKANTYLKDPDPDDERLSNAVTGLLLSGLLKRFESSTGAFRTSISRLIDQHERFLRALENGFVATTSFLKESTGTDDAEFDDLLAESSEVADASWFDVVRLKTDVSEDLSKLVEIYELLANVQPTTDPKLKALVNELIAIAHSARDESVSRQDQINKRKVLIFSFFADTVRWIHEFLENEIAVNSGLQDFKDRVEIVVGSGSGDGGDKAGAAARFAPSTAGKEGDPDKVDLLISTDVLAEGVNLQQARHIINYDLPWNPMRLVQRHGRIDRIGSQHNKVFMRTIFPANRLDALLGLEERIARKIAMAAASVGIVSPIADVAGGNRDFTETREEIQQLLDEDATLYQRGGTAAGMQSGEEYRQTLRKALLTRREEILSMPWKAGSGMRRGSVQGLFFCAKIGDRTYLRFVHTEKDWSLKYHSKLDQQQDSMLPMIDGELGRCLRFIECDESSELVMDETIQNAAYDLWLEARDNIHEHWMYETDPANLQPKVRPLNHKVAEYIRENPPTELEQTVVEKALDILESPWSRRDENSLRQWFADDQLGLSKSEYLVEQILRTGLEPFIPPSPLPPILKEDVELLVWIAIQPESAKARLF